MIRQTLSIALVGGGKCNAARFGRPGQAYYCGMPDDMARGWGAMGGGEPARPTFPSRITSQEGVATAAGQGSIRRPRAPKIFPLDWVSAQWREYAKQQLAAAALRSRLKKPTLGQNQKPARQQSIGEVMAVRDRAKGIAARPITFDSFTDSRGAKRPARELKMLQNLLKRPKNGVVSTSIVCFSFLPPVR